MVRDMTEGRPLKLILSFFFPLLIGNLFQQMYNMADSIIVGQFIGKGALAAVGATGSFNFLVLGFALGLCGGLCIPVSQRFGAGDMYGMRRALVSAIYITLGRDGGRHRGDARVHPADAAPHAHAGGHLRTELRLHHRHLRRHVRHAAVQPCRRACCARWATARRRCCF